MKVLIVHPCKGFYGGAEEVIVQLTNYLEGKGHTVQIVTRDAPKELIEGITNEKGRPAVYDWNSWRMMRWWVQKLTDWADVVNVHNFPATLMPFPKKIPTVWMCNEPAELFTNWKRKPIEAFNRWWVRKSGMKAAVADEVNAHRFFDIYGVVPTIIPYGVDYNFWSKNADYRGDESKALKLLQVGTITPYKNQLGSICTLAELLDAGVDAVLTLVGRVADEKYYSQLINDYISYTDKEEIPGFRNKIQFLGQRSQEEIRDQYNSHDVLLHPVEGQGGWLVPFEAMCAGLPVVVTLTFSASDLIARNRLGIVTGAMEEAILGEELGNLDVAAIRLWVKENLTWKKFGEAMVNMFKEVTR